MAKHQSKVSVSIGLLFYEGHKTWIHSVEFSVKIVRRHVGDSIPYFIKNHNCTDAIQRNQSNWLFSTGWASVKLKDFETGW